MFVLPVSISRVAEQPVTGVVGGHWEPFLRCVAFNQKQLVSHCPTFRCGPPKVFHVSGLCESLSQVVSMGLHGVFVGHG